MGVLLLVLLALICILFCLYACQYHYVYTGSKNLYYLNLLKKNFNFLSMHTEGKKNLKLNAFSCKLSLKTHAFTMICSHMKAVRCLFCISYYLNLPVGGGYKKLSIIEFVSNIFLFIVFSYNFCMNLIFIILFL